MIQHVKILQGHEGAIYKLHFDQKNRKLYSTGGDGWLVEWDVDHSENGVLIAKVPDKVFSLAVTPEFFLLGSFLGNFYVLDRGNMSILHEERAHKHGIFSILATGDSFYTFGGDGHIIRWNKSTFEKMNDFALTNKSVRAQALHPDGSLLATGSSDGNIYILSFPEMYLKKQITGAHDPSVFVLQWLDDYLLSGGRDALLKTWKISDDYSPELTLNAHWYAIYDLALTEDYLISSSRDKSIRWWNRDTLQPVQTIKWGEVLEAHVHSVNALAVDHSRKEVYSGSEDRTIRVWR